MEIPYEAHSFDAVIANMMLYHVPDIDRALAQIRRVLKPDGWFACAMNGERGMDAQALCDVTRENGKRFYGIR